MKTIWDISIDRYDTQPKVLIAVLRCDPRFSIKKVGSEIEASFPPPAKIQTFDSLYEAMGYCERREALI